MTRLPADGEFERARQQAAPSIEGKSRAPTIEVALATYNSEPFLEELLDSLFAQTCQGFTLIVADDGSTDRTLEILAAYGRRYPGRIQIVAKGKQPRGALGNFARLIGRATADYLMLCDHDDVWLPKKIALSLQRMKELESEHPAETPLLVHTDLIVTGQDLEVLGSSFFRYSRIDPARNDVPSLLTANVATGCTIMVNRALYERARPVPPEALMHDHWLAVSAAVLGAIGYVTEPTILYRQHGGNAIGAHTPGTATLMRRVRQTLFSDERRQLMLRHSRHAAALLSRYGAEMKPEHRKVTETLATFWSVSRWRRYRTLRQSGLGLRGFVRNAALLIVVSRSAPRDPEGA